jgi:hypothetical protein
MNSYFSDPSSAFFVVLFVAIGFAILFIVYDAMLTTYVFHLYCRTAKKLAVSEEFRAAILKSESAASDIAALVMAEHEATSKQWLDGLAKAMCQSKMKKIVEQERRKNLLDTIVSMSPKKEVVKAA